MRHLCVAGIAAIVLVSGLLTAACDDDCARLHQDKLDTLDYIYSPDWRSPAEIDAAWNIYRGLVEDEERLGCPVVR